MFGVSVVGFIPALTREAFSSIFRNVRGARRREHGGDAFGDKSSRDAKTRGHVTHSDVLQLVLKSGTVTLSGGFTAHPDGFEAEFMDKPHPQNAEGV